MSDIEEFDDEEFEEEFVEVDNSEVEEELYDKLKSWGIENFEIEQDAQGMVLAALGATNIERVYIDDENGLCIDCSYDKGEDLD